jgi:hypothetical protein
MTNTPRQTVSVTTYVVLTASAMMPGTCWGKYRRVAIIRVEAGGIVPRQIRNTKTAKVVSVWEKLHVGKTEFGAYQQQLGAAEWKAAQLNAAVKQ